MKRWAFTILLFLLLGAVVNVAVAWTSVWWTPLPVTDLVGSAGWSVKSVSAASPSGVHYEYLGLVRQDRPCGVRCWSGWCKPGRFSASFSWDEIQPHSITPSWSRLVMPTADYIEWDRHYRMEEARGWPMLSMWSGHVRCEKRARRTGEPRVRDAIDRRLWAIPLPSQTARVVVLAGVATGTQPTGMQQLSTRPIWPGFLINTLFYAIILWLLIPGPFVLRRLIRIRRGRCPRCGYDLRGQPPEAGAAGCPECGWNRAAPQAAQENAV